MMGKEALSSEQRDFVRVTRKTKENGMEENLNAVANEEGLIAVCNRKKNDKSPAKFYADKAIINGETVSYADVDVINMYGSTTTYSFFYANFSGYVKLKLRDGRKLKWKTGGAAFLGLGSYKTKKQLFAGMYDVSMKTLVKARAEAYLNEIRNGATVNIAGVAINSNGIAGKVAFKSVSVPFTEISGCDVASGYVRTYRTDNKNAVGAVAMQLDNAVCLVPVIETLVAAARAGQQ